MAEIFTDISRNLGYTSIFAKILTIFQTNLKKITKNCLLTYIINIHNGYLVIISTKY